MKRKSKWGTKLDRKREQYRAWATRLWDSGKGYPTYLEWLRGKRAT